MQVSLPFHTLVQFLPRLFVPYAKFVIVNGTCVLCGIDGPDPGLLSFAGRIDRLTSTDASLTLRTSLLLKIIKIKAQANATLEALKLMICICRVARHKTGASANIELRKR